MATAYATKGAQSMDKKTVSISSKRQITIPLKFFNKLGFENEAEYNNVEVYMSFTRKKLTFVEAKTEIKAVRGIGYELRCDDV